MRVSLDELDFEQQRRLLRLVVDDVLLQGGRVEIRLRIPLDGDSPASPDSPRGTRPRGPPTQDGLRILSAGPATLPPVAAPGLPWEFPPARSRGGSQPCRRSSCAAAVIAARKNWRPPSGSTCASVVVALPRLPCRGGWSRGPDRLNEEGPWRVALGERIPVVKGVAHRCQSPDCRVDAHISQQRRRTLCRISSSRTTCTFGVV